MSLNPFDLMQFTRTRLALGCFFLASCLFSWQLMAAPAFESVATNTTGNNDVQQLSVNLPSGVQENDLLLVVISTDGTVNSVPAPSGWTLILYRRSPNNDDDNGVTLAVFYRLATATEPGSYTFTWNENQEATGSILRYSGVDTTTPVDASGRRRGNSNTPRARDVTATVDDTLVVRIFGSDDDESPVTVPADSDSRVALISSSTGGATTQGVADREQPSAGATGNADFDLPGNGNERWATVTVVLRPDQSSVDLQVTKRVDSMDHAYPSEGDTITYTIGITNNGPDDDTNVEVVDSLPGGVTYSSHSATTGTYTTATGTWVIGNFANGASATLTIDATVDTGQADSTLIRNSASISGDLNDSVTSNNSDFADITTCPVDHIHNVAWVSSNQTDSNSLNDSDHICTQVLRRDYGDAPSGNYSNVSHGILSTLYIGSAPPDADSQTQGDNGLGDDSDGNDDEDGVVFRSPGGGDKAEVYADVSVANTTDGSVYLCAWLDRWNSSGTPGNSFDGGDISTTPAQVCQPVANGSHLVTFHWGGLPEATGDTYARFRLCSTENECNTPAGDASDGEVEDYPIAFDFRPTLVTIGQVDLEARNVGEFLAGLGVDQMDTSTLMALLAAWDPDTASLFAGAGRRAILDALADYLDPDVDGQVAVLAWDTLEERGTIGFYVDRRQDGSNWVRINSEMLPGLITAPMGGEYMLADPTARSGNAYQYLLIEQEARGATRTYGPYRVEMPQ